MKTRWGCRRSCWSQGKVDWPAASHVLIKRLTARTMLMFRNDLVSTRGPPSSPNFLYRSIFFPFPKVQRNSKRAPYFQAPPRLSYRSLLSATPRLCSYEPLISTVIPPPPNLPTFGERITPIFSMAQKDGMEKVFIRSSTLRENSSFSPTTFLLERWRNFANLFLFIPFHIQRLYNDAMIRRN